MPLARETGVNLFNPHNRTFPTPRSSLVSAWPRKLICFCNSFRIVRELVASTNMEADDFVSGAHDVRQHLEKLFVMGRTGNGS